MLYGAVKLSPFGFKPTVTIVALLIALFAMVLLGVSGQALSPGRQLQAIARYRRSPKRWTLPAAARQARARARRRPAARHRTTPRTSTSSEISTTLGRGRLGPADDRRQVLDEGAEGVLE